MNFLIPILVIFLITLIIYDSKIEKKGMASYSLNIEKATLKNNHFRKVIYTDKKQQIVLMSLKEGEFIHKEKHNGTQFFRIESGIGIAKVNGKTIKLKDGISLSVPGGVFHEIINTSKEPLKLYTVYSPPQHKDKTITKRQKDDTH